MTHRVFVPGSTWVGLLVSTALLSAGCSSARPRVAFAVADVEPLETPAPAPAAAPARAPAGPEAAPTAAPRTVDDVLATCAHAEPGTKCALSAADAEEVCRSMTPSAALHVFLNNKSLEVGFLTRTMDAWSTGHGRHTRSQARFDEEVLVLAKRVSRGSVVQGTGVTYEVLRWDGSCASLMREEVTFKRAPRPVRPLAVDRLPIATQKRLLADERVRVAALRADAICRDSDELQPKCDEARRAFGDAVRARGPKLGL